MAEFRVLFTAGDYRATVAFLTDVMGLDVLRSWDDGAPGTILLAADGQIEVFAPRPDGPVEPVTGARLAWEIGDAHAEHDRLLAAGAEILQPPQRQPWGSQRPG